MFHPVGSQPPSVYWRRRFVLVATLVVLLLLIVLTVRAVTSGADGSPRRPAAAAGASSPRTSQTPTAHPSSLANRRYRGTPSAGGSRTSSSRATSHESSATGGHRAGHHPSAKATSSPPPAQCSPSELAVQAYTPQQTYHVGDKPLVELQVTDTGTQPCVQNLADKQVVLKVYDGVSRVWGSHDCAIEPGTDDRVLAVNQPVRVSVMWSGYTSQPGCSGTRQRVGAGEYTLYVWLAGHEGKATQFSIV